MYYAYKTININPLKPVKQYGHIQQVNPVYKCHDDLHARITALNDGIKTFIHVSVDSLGTPYSLQKQLEERVAELMLEPFKLIVSSTHTHYAADPNDRDYYNQLCDQIYEGIRTMEPHYCDELTCSYISEPFEGVGTSRITGHKANVILGLLTIKADSDPVIRYIYHNVHPTVLSADEADYFSADWPGYVLNTLNRRGKVFNVFLQGAAGDISTRFTRKDQSYASVRQLGGRLLEELAYLEYDPVVYHPLSLTFTDHEIQCHHQFNEISFDEMPAGLSARELETIQVGGIMRAELEKHPEMLAETLHVTKVSLGTNTLIFEPNELFSGYLDYIDTDKDLLVCYSNGYETYVTPPNSKLFTYETFTDTLTDETKEELIKALRN